jgi:hypothetical protein
LSFQPLSHPKTQRGCGKTLVTRLGDQRLSLRRENRVCVVQYRCIHPDGREHRAKRIAAGIQPGKIIATDCRMVNDSQLKCRATALRHQGDGREHPTVIRLLTAARPAIAEKASGVTAGIAVKPHDIPEAKARETRHYIPR